MTEEKRLIAVDDLLNIKAIQDVQLSPDGQWIAYVVSTPDKMQNSYKTHIYLARTTGSDPVQITFTGKDSSPRWSPDSTQLAFVSARNEKPQIFILPVNRPGEARTLTSNKNGARNPVWSPDGTLIAFMGSVNTDERAKEDSTEEPEAPKDTLEGKHRKEREDEDFKNRFDPQPMERIPYRQGTTFRTDRYSAIYVIRTEEGLEADDAKARRMTDLDVDYLSVSWSPDSETLYTTRAFDTEADEFFRYQNIYTIDVDSAVERRIPDDKFRAFDPFASPDGKFLLTQRSVMGSTDHIGRLSLIPLEGGEIVNLNLDFDRDINAYDWTPDGKIIVSIPMNGHVEIHEIDPETKTFTPLVDDDTTIMAWHYMDGNLAFVRSTTDKLDELYYQEKGADIRQITNVNADFLQKVKVGETHHINYTNSAGDTIDGWYVLPPDYDASKKYPLALNIHGGPHTMWLPSIRSMWQEWQCHAAAGYIVFYCNPRGSRGYGEKFQRDLHSAWGDVAMEDILTGVQQLIDKDMIDTDRMAITGGSYGGYMTGWIITHKPDMFAAAVSQRGVYNLSSFVGTSDVPFLIENEFDAAPWDNHQKLWEHSPVAYAHEVKTPTLLIHSENDYRVPIEQAEQFFAFIRRSTDTPIKMLRYPREGHELSRSGEPKHRISRLQEMVNWFDKYCQPEKLEAED